MGILVKLEKKYGKEGVSLKFRNSLQLLVAVALSAQTTDININKITPALFKECKTAKDYATISLSKLEKLVYSTGFYKQKAKRLKEMGKMLVKNFNGKVPNTMEDLLTLPGVARKTANIVLSEGFGKVEGIAVDTHVKRVAFRLGLTKFKDPNKIEQDLMKKISRKYWKHITLNLILHGRKVCGAKNAKCGECFLNKDCPSAFKVDI